MQHTEGEEENGPDDEVRANAGNESASFCFDGCGDDHCIKEILTRYGVKKLTELSENQYEAVKKEVAAL